MTVPTDAQKSDTLVSKERRKVLSTGAVQVWLSRIVVSRPIQWGSSATADAEIHIKIPASNKRLARLTPWGGGIGLKQKLLKFDLRVLFEHVFIPFLVLWRRCRNDAPSPPPRQSLSQVYNRYDITFLLNAQDAIRLEFTQGAPRYLCSHPTFSAWFSHTHIL